MITKKFVLDLIQNAPKVDGTALEAFFFFNSDKAIMKIERTTGKTAFNFNASNWASVATELINNLPIKEDGKGADFLNISSKIANSRACINKRNSLGWEVRGNHHNGQAFGEVFDTKKKAYFYAVENVL